MTNQAAVKEYVRAFNAGEIEALRKVFAPDALIHGVMGWGQFDQVAPMWTVLHDSFNMHLEMEQIVESGKEVIVRFTERGHFVGAFRGQLPTQQTSEVVAIEWFQMQDGLIRANPDWISLALNPPPKSVILSEWNEPKDLPPSRAPQADPRETIPKLTQTGCALINSDPPRRPRSWGNLTDAYPRRGGGAAEIWAPVTSPYAAAPVGSQGRRNWMLPGR